MDRLSQRIDAALSALQSGASCCKARIFFETHLDQANQLEQQADRALDLFAEELRLAQDRLSSITGEFSSDDLVGVIFGRFCIGN